MTNVEKALSGARIPFHTGDMTCRDEILAVIRELVQDRPDGIFSLSEVMRIMHQQQSPYLLSTIARNVTTVMCVGALNGVRRQHDDLERVSRGRYRLSLSSPLARGHTTPSER